MYALFLRLDLSSKFCNINESQWAKVASGQVVFISVYLPLAHIFSIQVNGNKHFIPASLFLFLRISVHLVDVEQHLEAYLQLCHKYSVFYEGFGSSLHTKVLTPLPPSA